MLKTKFKLGTVKDMNTRNMKAKAFFEGDCADILSQKSKSMKLVHWIKCLYLDVEEVVSDFAS